MSETVKRFFLCVVLPLVLCVPLCIGIYFALKYNPTAENNAVFERGVAACKSGDTNGCRKAVLWVNDYKEE